MANKKEINQKSGPRLRELIKELNMTQAQFGEIVGLGSHHISSIVTGTRRLTEENAKRIAELFPNVRFEWLMGWDDLKTIGQEKLRNKLGFAVTIQNRQRCIINILSLFGYKLEHNKNKEIQKSFRVSLQDYMALLGLEATPEEFKNFFADKIINLSSDDFITIAAESDINKDYYVLTGNVSNPLYIDADEFVMFADSLYMYIEFIVKQHIFDLSTKKAFENTNIHEQQEE